MGAWYRLQELTAIAAGTAGGLAIYLHSTNAGNDKVVHNSWTNCTKMINGSGKWDYNWDLREPRCLIESSPGELPEEQNKYNQKLESVVPKVTRHIIMIRHGEYLDVGESDAEKHLTDVGRYQAKYTGERLKALNIKWDRVVASTQTRAQETAKIITTVLNYHQMENCNLIREGAPIPPDPPVGHWKPGAVQFFRDGPRIEAGFRRYFHRADAKETKDTYLLLVGHGNVIRYFVCRALQFPPEAWLRISLNHGSITWISILPSGRVSLRTLGDSGHIPPELITHK